MSKKVSSAINPTFLTDVNHGGNKGQPQKIAEQLAEFIDEAKSNLHIAIYDFRLTESTLAEPVITALKNKAQTGVKVRIAFDHGKPETKTVDPFIASGSDPAPKGTKAFLESVFEGTQVEIKSIAGSKLMHNKYVIRDVNTSEATLWTGSANFTDDAWTYQDNNILQISSPQLCSYYETDFQELWVSGNIKTTGVGDTGKVYIASTEVDFAFSPGEGQTIDHIISSLIGSAKNRIKIASMMITSHAILAALDDALRHKQVKDLSGVYDATQMSHVVKLWLKTEASVGVAETFKEVSSHLVGKHSEPYKPDSKHNFMHNKVVVCDNIVVSGSFNFSRSATQNAENIVVLHDPSLAEQYSDYIDQLLAHYSKV
ncbi:MAG: phosphatidylserine/phosphatidylglycerophosphate/cardiolipin synthase family protein [Nostoc sp.]|uniref:phospholipase D-like domain-containing protein n=1 Tax=Nostoc sp. TaxID=1180 RepID=UPI002FF6B384